MQIRSFRGSGEPARVNALPSARFCLGPDPRRALGPAASPAASTGRTRDRTRPILQLRQKVLASAPSTRDPRRTSRPDTPPWGARERQRSERHEELSKRPWRTARTDLSRLALKANVIDEVEELVL